MAEAGSRGARVGTAVAAVVLAAGVAASSDAAVGAVGVAVLVAALVLARGALVAWALLALAGAYAFARAGDPGVDGGAPLVATGLLLVAELAFWSIELAATAREERMVALRRLGSLVALGAGALGLATLVLAATAVPLSQSAAWNGVGIAAAAAVVGLIAWLAHRSPPERAQ